MYVLKMSIEIFHLTSFFSSANNFFYSAYIALIYILSLIESLKKLDEISHAYRERARFQKYF